MKIHTTSFNMMVQQITDLETNISFESVITLPPAAETQVGENDALSNRTLRRPRTNPRCNFQDPASDYATPILYAALHTQDEELVPEFSNYRDQSEVVASIATTLIHALKFSYEKEKPINGTKTYTTKDELGDGKEREYILFARERSLIDEKGNKLTEAERTSLRNENVQYTGPKTIPVIPISESITANGSPVTICIGLAYAEERNPLRYDTKTSATTQTDTTWFFGLSLFSFNGTIEDFYRKNPPMFTAEEATEAGNPAMLAIAGHTISSVADRNGLVAFANYAGDMIQNSKNRKPKGPSRRFPIPIDSPSAALQTAFSAEKLLAEKLGKLPTSDQE